MSTDCTALEPEGGHDPYFTASLFEREVIDHFCRQGPVPGGSSLILGQEPEQAAATAAWLRNKLQEPNLEAEIQAFLDQQQYCGDLSKPERREPYAARAREVLPRWQKWLAGSGGYYTGRDPWP